MGVYEYMWRERVSVYVCFKSVVVSEYVERQRVCVCTYVWG